MVQYLEKLHELHNDLPRFEMLVANLQDKAEHVIHI